MRRLLLFFFLLTWFPSWSQPGNDDCAGATLLTQVESWCSDTEAYTNGNATQSADDLPRCLLQSASTKDLWFTFTTIGTDLNVRVIGQTDRMPGGTLSNPEIAVYEGSCGQLVERGCNSDAFNAGFVELLLDKITTGGQYFIRVSGRDNSSGTFQLCVNSFNNVADPNSDCPTAVVLCDKSSFVVEALTGTGSIQDEADNSCLDLYDRQINSEKSSAWYKWVAGRSGSLSFTITPNNPSDDLDFAVFELPNGLQDCEDKILLRCMASGEQGGCDFSVWEPCTGPTGLKISSSDLIEDPGCNVDNPCVGFSSGTFNDNFVSALEIEEGKAYALIVNNYTQSGNGFSIEFGGSGDFLGPEADFITDDADGTVCYGDPITYFDQSTFGDLSITSWDWNFGEGAVPQQASGPGPHVVRYQTGGSKSIALAVQGETGCVVTTIGNVIVEEPFDVAADLVHQSCPESMDGAITLDVNSGSSISSIIWDNGTIGGTLTNLMPGDYQVMITNFNGCDTSILYTIEAPMPLSIDQVITRPSCGGTADGSITINVTGQAPPFLFNFNRGGGFSTSNSLNGLSADVYQIEVQDANGCITELTVPLGEITIDLDASFDPVTPPSCFGFSDGEIEIRILGGNPPFAYDWNLDGSFDGITNKISGLPAGGYIVGVRDDQGCLGYAIVEISDPPELLFVLDTIDISCFGADDGSVVPVVSGGTGAYTYSWNNGTTDSVVVSLSAGQYTLNVIDANGCQASAAAAVAEPPAVRVVIDSTRDVLCFGDATGSLFYSSTGGSPPFKYSVDGRNFTDSLFIHGLSAGDYQLQILDDRGCMQSVPVSITQPARLQVDAGQDTTISLGFTTPLQAAHQPPGKPVIYQWTPPESLACTDCPGPTAGPVNTTIYTVTVMDDNNCTARDQVTVTVFLDRPVYIPNSFSPNGDGFNDRLSVYGGGAAMEVRRLQIYDRWGELVFEGNNLSLNDESMGWDGTHHGQALNPGVFVYLAEIAFIDSSVLEFEGDITLIR